MEKSDICKGLATFNDKLTSQTYKNTYREQSRDSLLIKDNSNSLATRANSIWKMAQYLVAYKDKEENVPIGKFLDGWKLLTKVYKDQFLIIQNDDYTWSMYDSNSRYLGGDDYIKKYIKDHESLSSHIKSSHITLDYQTNNVLPLLVAIRTKPFILLAGISGTGKSRIVRKLAQTTVTEELQGYTGNNFETDRWTIHNPVNFEIIQVKPNWHNSMDVVGYLSNIPTPHYEFTPFVKFIAKAWQYPDVPFFLCLDEMNLAPVEEYFAEYLSAIESRGFENGEYITDPIIKPFKDFNSTVKPLKGNYKGKENVDVCEVMLEALLPNYKDGKSSDETTNKLAEHFKNKGLTLPKNIIVIGTVNMDETTFSFSRKVLDRAMSIEMNEVNYDSFLDDTTDDDIKSIEGAIGTTRLDDLLVNRPVDGHLVIDNIGNDNASLAIGYLKLINGLLEGTSYKLGYRAANEALLYISSAKDFGNEDTNSALDDFTLMKILSRIEGDTTKLALSESDNIQQLRDANVNIAEVKNENRGFNILTALKDIIITNLGVKSNVEGTGDEMPNGSKLRTVKKLNNMISQLNRDRFVSYWN